MSEKDLEKEAAPEASETPEPKPAESSPGPGSDAGMGQPAAAAPPPPSTTLPPAFEQSRGGRGSTTLLGIVIAALLILAFYLASVLNSYSFYIESTGGQLTILKGRMFPFGTTPYQPDDETLSRTYAPVPLPDNPPESIASMGKVKFGDFFELNQAFFDVLVDLARAQIYTEVPEKARYAEVYLQRAARLPTVGTERQQLLQRLRGDLAYKEGRALLEGLSDRIRRAAGKFRKAQELGTERYTDVDAWLRRAERSMGAFGELSGQPAAPEGEGGELAEPLDLEELDEDDAETDAEADAEADGEADTEADAEADPEPEAPPVPYPGGQEL